MAGVVPSKTSKKVYFDSRKNFSDLDIVPGDSISSGRKDAVKSNHQVVAFAWNEVTEKLIGALDAIQYDGNRVVERDNTAQNVLLV